MKFDGHIKLTAAAVKKIKNQCPTLTITCNAPMFKSESFRIWLGDKNKSTAIDNYSSAFVNYIGHSLAPDFIYQVKLPDAVAFVDINESWTHESPAGQRFHFMRAENERNDIAHLNGCNFIREQTENWVNEAKRAMHSNKQPLANARLSETRQYVKSLALALHSLQDSFSPGHTDRFFGDKPRMSTPVLAPVRNLHVYSKQNHGKHGNSDYQSGGTKSQWGNHAVDASAALIKMGIISIPAPGQGLIGWESFKMNWLDSKF